MIRANKVSQNVDDFRVLIAGLIVGALILIFANPVMFFYDKYIDPLPLLSATVEIEDRGADGVFVAYDADASQPVDGIWIASVHNEGGDRLSSRRGDGRYSDKIDNPRAWSWAAFFDAEDGAPPPAIPNEAFYLCVRYIATARDSGYTEETPAFCSNVLVLAQ
ncbi:MAG: hypothetical protein ACPG4X_16455 [Pikeienuella sp.]